MSGPRRIVSRPTEITCEDCGRPRPVHPEGVLPSFCGDCAAARERARVARWKASRRAARRVEP